MRTEPLPIVGVELGARMENTAISVTERVYVPTGDLFNVTRYDHRRSKERLEARETVAVEYRGATWKGAPPRSATRGSRSASRRSSGPWASSWWRWTLPAQAARSTP